MDEQLKAAVNELTDALHESHHPALALLWGEIERLRTQTQMAVHDAITRALDEADVRPEVLRGMCVEVGLEKFNDAMNAVSASPEQK
jgi:hypothetical protein